MLLSGFDTLEFVVGVLLSSVLEFLLSISFVTFEAEEVEVLLVEVAVEVELLSFGVDSPQLKRTRDKEQIRKEIQSLVLLRLQTKDKEELEKLKEQICTLANLALQSI